MSSQEPPADKAHNSGDEDGPSKTGGASARVTESIDEPELTSWREKRRFNWLSIRWQILVIAFVAAIAFAAYLSFNFIQSNSQAQMLESIRDTRYPVQAKLQEAFFNIRLIQAKFEDAVVTGELESLAEVKTLETQFIQSMLAVQDLDAGNQHTAARIIAAFVEYFGASYQLAEDLIEGRLDIQSSGARGTRSAALYSEVLGLLDSVKEDELTGFSKAVTQVTERANSIVNIGAPIGLITVIVLFVLATIVSRNIIKRVNNMVTTLRTIARDNGDMSVRIPVHGQDEMAELAFWFNSFIAKLDRITRKSTAEIKRLAYTDSLTDLPNRRMFNIHLGNEIDRCKRHAGRRLAVMFLDLDNFKVINDQLGHEAGDLLINEVARRLVHTVRGHDIVAHDFDNSTADSEPLVARMGGDEFMLVISDITDAQQAAIVADRVRETILAPIEILGTGVEIGVSVGIALYPDNGSSTDELITNADLAMYEAKGRGKNNYCFFNAELEAAAKFNLAVESALRDALEHDSLRLDYQPKYDTVSGELKGAEALLRWSSDEFGDLSPARFLPIAEGSELIFAVDEWVLSRVSTQIREWLEAGLQMVPIAVNISTKQAVSPDFADKVRAVIERAALPDYSLEVEITEASALSDILPVAKNLRALREMCVAVALDDFGSGALFTGLVQVL